jgi:hypothetical protein
MLIPSLVQKTIDNRLKMLLFSQFALLLGDRDIFVLGEINDYAND